MTGGDSPGTRDPGQDDGDPSDGDEGAAGEQAGNRDPERVIRHRMSGHRAALGLAQTVDQPDLLGPQIEETEHRLAEDEDILEEIAPEDPDR
ncbi:MAG TPA: hypothetical protein VFT70_12215 [Nocardioides sp.]|nr:hypothetical protein [Nocardioides sp.]